MNNIADRLQILNCEIEKFVKKYHREPGSVELLAVSKTKPVDLIVDAYRQGIRKFGENYVSEVVEKIEILKEHTDIEWHYIGPIQSNKTRPLAENVNWIHSVDREKIASRLSEQRPEDKGPLNVLIQVNIDNEASKAGVLLDEVAALAGIIDSLPRLNLRGLMAIPSKTDDIDAQMQAFAKLNHCFTSLKAQYNQVDTLSMGMSGDMEAAIAHGSTMVRIGTAIFGAREKK
jgi:pyridoxal phosphate enzyme (YggS family)